MTFKLKIFVLVLFLTFLPIKAYSEEKIDKESQNLISFNNHIVFRFGMLNNFINSYITGDAQTTIPLYQQLGTIEIGSDYWFGLINQQELYKLGVLFGVGFYLTYGKYYFIDNDPSLDKPQTIDTSIYLLSLEFLKIPLFKDKKNNYLLLTGNYISYSNNLMPFSNSNYSRPFSGLGIGLKANYDFDIIGQVNGKIMFLPYISSYPLSDIYGLNTEIGYKYFILPTTAINLNYKFNFYTANTQVTAKLENKNTTSNFNVNIHDIVHTISLGTEYYF